MQKIELKPPAIFKKKEVLEERNKTISKNLYFDLINRYFNNK
jgi:hypothetical protein